MTTLSLRLPESLHKGLKELARKEGISVNQLICTAAAEKLSALMTVEYLKERAERGDRSRFEAVLAKVADDVPADPSDRVDRSRPRGQRGR